MGILMSEKEIFETKHMFLDELEKAGFNEYELLAAKKMIGYFQENGPVCCIVDNREFRFGIGGRYLGL